MCEFSGKYGKYRNKMKTWFSCGQIDFSFRFLLKCFFYFIFIPNCLIHQNFFEKKNLFKKGFIKSVFIKIFYHFVICIKVFMKVLFLETKKKIQDIQIIIYRA